MRELKFRVWDNENKSYDDPYSYAYYALTQDGGLDFYCHGDHMKEANPDVYFIEQYTGLKDKNGKEIYEGDVVRVVRSYGYGFLPKGAKAKIEFDEKELCYKLRGQGEFRLTAKKELEVIGNIHENPELCGEEEE